MTIRRLHCRFVVGWVKMSDNLRSLKLCLEIGGFLTFSLSPQHLQSSHSNCVGWQMWLPGWTRVWLRSFHPREYSLTPLIIFHVVMLLPPNMHFIHTSTRQMNINCSTLIKAHSGLFFGREFLSKNSCQCNCLVPAPPLRVPSPLPLPLYEYSNVFYAHFFTNFTLCFMARGLYWRHRYCCTLAVCEVLNPAFHLDGEPI